MPPRPDIGVNGNGIAVPAYSQSIIIDHRHTDLAKVPSQWIKLAKSSLRSAYQHNSHGSQLVTGIQAITSTLEHPYNFASTGSGYTAGVFLNDYGIAGASDLGAPHFTDWYDSTRNLLNRTGGCDRNVVIWSWCGQVSGATVQTSTPTSASWVSWRRSFRTSGSSTSPAISMGRAWTAT